MEGEGSRMHISILQLLTSQAGSIEAAILLSDSRRSFHPFLQSYYLALVLLAFLLLVDEVG